MFSVYSATAHFKYDPTTFANNVALLKFNQGGTRQWKNYIGANPSDWTSKFFVSRSVTGSQGGSMPAWQPTQDVVVGPDVSAQCAAASVLFANNPNDLVCTSQVVTSAAGGNPGCALPYSSVYGVHDPDLAIAGLYSHSVIVGSSLCKYTQIYNYYTLLSNYLEWGGDVAKSTVYLYVADLTYVNNNNPNYSMVVPSGQPSVSGIVVGGDLSGNSPKPTPSSSSSSSSSSPTSTSTTSTFTSTSDTSSSDTSASGQNSGKQGMNIGIILLIVGLILLVIAIIAFLLYRRYKKRKEQQQPRDFLDVNSNYGDGNLNPDYLDRKDNGSVIGDSNLYAQINTDGRFNGYGGNNNNY
ncbi:hypothetical protein IWW38_003696 [Coemansia aciculifera]|uniref:Uncharacterized protein n=1 Tax=Coemansia aciculifera TaxID=417176 RepID=A0ACC1LZX7_9FUNG|nr:hypothetical protein IWW38_003696 [Coemansia aciculifera]